MLRQRVRLRGSALGVAGRILVGLLGLALAYYGAMLAALALKTSPATVESLSGYRAATDALTGLRAGDATTATRAITAAAGVLAAVVFGALARAQLPRPYRARGPLVLREQDDGDVIVRPRTVERIGEVAALATPDVGAARGRLDGDRLVVAVTLRLATQSAETLRQVRSSIHSAIAVHGLEARPVDVVLSAFDRSNRRDLR